MASLSFSLGGGAKRREPSPPRNGVKRAHAALDDDDSEGDDAPSGKRHDITHFDLKAGGAVDASKPKVVKQALVIQPQANRDWKEASQRKRQKYGLPTEEQDNAKKDFVPDVPTTTFGLNVFKKDGDAPEEAESTAAAPATSEETAESAPMPTRPKTLDELAIDALLGVKPESTLAIPAVTEEEAFERDFRDAPDAPTLEEYAAVPVDEFGAAMLRGMGWKEGMGIGTQKGKKMEKSKVPARRPALLGIGAKADAAVADELGAWGRGAKGKKRSDIVYNPLVMRNAKTGEKVTEEELKLKLQEQKDSESMSRRTRAPERDHDRSANSSRRQRDGSHASDDERERKRREHDRDRRGDRDRARDEDYHSDKHSSRRDYSADRQRSNRDRSRSYDLERERYRHRKHEDRRDKDPRRRERDGDDRSSDSRRARYDDDRYRRHHR